MELLFWGMRWSFSILKVWRYVPPKTSAGCHTLNCTLDLSFSPHFTILSSEPSLGRHYIPKPWLRPTSANRGVEASTARRLRMRSSLWIPWGSLGGWKGERAWVCITFQTTSEHKGLNLANLHNRVMFTPNLAECKDMRPQQEDMLALLCSFEFFFLLGIYFLIWSHIFYVIYHFTVHR